jgi:FkbM family methyltransferase
MARLPPMSLLSMVRRTVRRATLDVVRFHPRSHPLARRMHLLGRHGIDVVFDVGANSGQYARELRQLGYRGRMVSFEPLAAAFATLRAHSAADRRWQVEQLALGDVPGRAHINVAGNSVSSSLLPMLETHARSAPASAYVGTEEIAVDTLAAAIARHLARVDERLFVKIDAQGYEQRILDGAGAALARVVGLQLEMSLVPLYEGETLLAPMVERLAARGFTLMSLEPGYGDPESGQLLQVDGLFFRAAS